MRRLGPQEPSHPLALCVQLAGPHPVSGGRCRRGWLKSRFLAFALTSERLQMQRLRESSPALGTLDASSTNPGHCLLPQPLCPASGLASW